ncbi:hypothetical protein GLOTRDRAFT_101448 [Gloeophyllum trabeum ATCC 11539]|uniref:MARVEL domain-containing protein n=1 Tax=Gloeophyllum trabeum (strain ATCC 11539 / FP-39264 / Madison 617) TaxID=670483 RepID=S7PVC7_GLOTA|nr:uncharacterized protein GLOTRDRAFT_101448 [Gloeophyllum trabeum ATCC 11539]EPQ51581.1 hypothetical protein GLOTRDRAFT_101448 [Gloeophyllum trabeum ATCC 11539]
MADLFPLGLSIATLILLFFMFLFNFAVINSFLVRAPFQIGILFIASVFWLAFNAFSTSRWAHITMSCGSIPGEYADARAWCRDVQGLKAVVWIEWVMLTFTAFLTFRHAITQQNRGHTHIWTQPLVRYHPRHGARRGDSEFLQFEKVGVGMAF